MTSSQQISFRTQCSSKYITTDANPIAQHFIRSSILELHHTFRESGLDLSVCTDVSGANAILLRYYLRMQLPFDSPSSRGPIRLRSDQQLSVWTKHYFICNSCMAQWLAVGLSSRDKPQAHSVIRRPACK